MNAYKLTEKQNWSLGRAGLLITSGGGMVEVAFHGVQYRALAQRVCDEMNGVQQVEQPLPMGTAPRDGTLVRLLVEFDDNATDDGPGPHWTIGANNLEHDGEDEWKFAGWNWNFDEFTAGFGKPVGWLPMVSGQAVKP